MDTQCGCLKCYCSIISTRWVWNVFEMGIGSWMEAFCNEWVKVSQFSYFSITFSFLWCTNPNFHTCVYLDTHPTHTNHTRHTPPGSGILCELDVIDVSDNSCKSANLSKSTTTRMIERFIILCSQQPIRMPTREFQKQRQARSAVCMVLAISFLFKRFWTDL